MSTDTPRGCEHDKRFNGVFGLPRIDGGCLACAFERTEQLLVSAQATITGDGKVIDQYRERLSSVTEERDRLKRELEGLQNSHAKLAVDLFNAEQQLAASRGAVIEKGILAEQRSSDRIVALQDAVIGLEAKDIELARALSIQRELLEQECQDGDKILALFPHLTRTEGGRLPIPRLLNTIRTLSASAAKKGNK